MSELKPQPISLERLIKLFEAFVIFSDRTGVKVKIIIDPTEIEEKEKEEGNDGDENASVH